MKLHLGCGPRHIPGFFHVDANDHPHVDHRGDVSNLDFLEEGQAELIYACHLLEHFDRAEVPVVLKEWNRVLKSGGVLRLSVPGFEQLVAIYKAQGDLKYILGPLVGGQRDQYDYHKIVFDRSFLEGLLHEAGFSEIREWDWRTTEHSAVDDYSQAYVPHMQKDTGLPVSLNIEAVKS